MVDCIVEFDYEAEQPDELSIKVGQTIKNVMTEDGGWWEGELDGKKGMFPDNFVKIIDKSHKEKAHATPDKKEELKKPDKKEELKKDLKTQQRSSVRDLASKIKDGIPVGGSQKKKESHQPVIKRAKVLFSYEPDNEDELKLDADDIVEVFKQEEEGWWEGSLNGKVGVFPSNFVEVIEELDPAVKTEHIPEEKPKEPPQAEPKTKKIVGGVGLGNIFDGGPIKLRSATGAKKQAEHETKPDEPPSHPPAGIPKKEKPESIYPPEHATPKFTDQRAPSPSSDLSANFFSSVFDRDYSDSDINSLPDLNMLQPCNKIPQISVLELDHNVCIVDVHDNFLKNVPSQVYPDLDPVLKASCIMRRAKDGVHEDSLIEYEDVELENEHERIMKYQDVTKTFKLSDFVSKISITNANNNNLSGRHVENKGINSVIQSHEQTSLKNSHPEVIKVKKKKSLMDRINLNIFARKSKTDKDMNIAFNNRVSPIASSTKMTVEKEKFEVEEYLKEEIEFPKEVDKYTINDFTTNENKLQKFSSSAEFRMPLSSNTKEIISNFSIDPRLKRFESDMENGNLELLSRTHHSAPNIKYQNLSHKSKQKDNYLATLNETNKLSPFMRVIANKYHLFDEKTGGKKPVRVVQEVERGDNSKPGTSCSLRNESDKKEFVQEENPYVSTMFGEHSPEKDDSASNLSRKRKSPLPRSVPPKKRQMTKDSQSKAPSLTEKDFVSNYVENVLDDVIKELNDENYDTVDSLFSHHKEEFEQIRDRFEFGTVNLKEGTKQNVYKVPKLATLCKDVLDNWEKRYIAMWKKKYQLSSYSPVHRSYLEENSYSDPDRYTKWSCPSGSALGDEIYEPYRDGQLSWVGEDLSRSTFSKEVDSFYIDQSSLEGCNKKSPWVSPVPVRREFGACTRQIVPKLEQEDSTMSYYSDQSTQTADLDSSELVNISESVKPVRTRTVSTSPIQELLMVDMSMDDNKSRNSLCIHQSSPFIKPKPRYSSSPIANIPNVDSSLEDNIGEGASDVRICNNLGEINTINQLENLNKPYTQSSCSTLTNESYQHASKVQRSRTLNYLSELAQSLAERRKRRFAFKHLFIKQEVNPVKLVSFKKLSDSLSKLDVENITRSDDLAQKKENVQITSVNDEMDVKKNNMNLMQSFFPHGDYSTNDTFFNRSFDEDSEKENVGSPPQCFHSFGKWTVSYEDQQPQFAFHEVENKKKKFEFCSTYGNLIGCGGDKNSSANPLISDRKVENIDTVRDPRKVVCQDYLETEIISPGCSPFVFEKDQHSTEDINGSYVRKDENTYTYPESPLPENLKLEEDSGDIVEDDLSPDSLSFIASLARDMKGYNFSETPKADDVDDEGAYLNEFLQEALKPLDDLLSDISSNEDQFVTQLSPSRWGYTTSDYPSFVSFREDENSHLSDTSDVYPEPDLISEYDPLNLEKVLSDEDLVPGEGHTIPRTPVDCPTQRSKHRDEMETLDDWLNFNEMVSEYTTFDRKERYPTFTFVTPHKIDHLACGDSSVKKYASLESESVTLGCRDKAMNKPTKEVLFSTPGPHIYRSPQPNTCENSFISVSEMSFNESRGCTPYYTDIDMDITVEDPVLANTNNNEPLTTGNGLNSSLDFLNDINNNRSVNDSDLDFDSVIIPDVDKEEVDIVDI